MRLLFLTTLLCAAATGGADDVPRNSGGRGAAPPVDDAKSSAGPTPLDSLAAGQPVILLFADATESPGFKDPVFGYMDHNGVAFPATHQPTGWKPAPE